jgi:hypothetical protein
LNESHEWNESLERQPRYWGIDTLCDSLRRDSNFAGSFAEFKPYRMDGKSLVSPSGGGCMCRFSCFFDLASIPKAQGR